MSLEQFSDFSGLITSHLGIRLPEGKRLMLQNRLARRARALGLSSVPEYHKWFFADGPGREEELQHLLDVATTNKTSFFRESGHFAALREIAQRADVARDAFRVWCAGCATGEEAYTLAMVLLEARAEGGPAFSILATDVCSQALERARAAIYDRESVAAVPEPFRTRYFLRHRDPAVRAVRVAPEVRRCVRFGHLNFLSEDYGLPETVNAVFFRNVMIYFDRTTQRAVLGRICSYLAVGGHLFVGHSESASGQGLPLTVAGTSVFRREEGPP